MVMLTSTFTTFATDLRHVLAIVAHGFSALAPDLRHVLAILTHALATLLADLGHMASIFAHALAAFLAGVARLVGRELVRRSLLVRRFSTFARDLALLFVIHRGKAAVLTASLGSRRSIFIQFRVLVGLLCVDLALVSVRHDQALLSASH